METHEQEEEKMLRISCAAAYTVMVVVMIFIAKARAKPRAHPIESYETRQLFRRVHLHRILWGSNTSCLDYIRMRRGPFFNLVRLMKENHLLVDTIHCSVEEQLAMSLHILGHKTKNRVMKIEFIRSGETVSRYFNKVLGAICELRDRFLKQAPNETPTEVEESSYYFPYFKVNNHANLDSKLYDIFY